MAKQLRRCHSGGGVAGSAMAANLGRAGLVVLLLDETWVATEVSCNIDLQMRFRDLDPNTDRCSLEQLWRAAMAPTWPLLPNSLDLIRAGLIAEAGDLVAGAVAFRRGWEHPSVARPSQSTAARSRDRTAGRSHGTVTRSRCSPGQPWKWRRGIYLARRTYESARGCPLLRGERLDLGSRRQRPRLRST